MKSKRDNVMEQLINDVEFWLKDPGIEPAELAEVLRTQAAQLDIIDPSTPVVVSERPVDAAAPGVGSVYVVTDGPPTVDAIEHREKPTPAITDQRSDS